MQSIERRLTTLLPDVVTAQNANQKGLYMKWQRVDGKLVCQWLQQPD